MRVGIILFAGLALAACGNGGSAVETRERSAGGDTAALTAVGLDAPTDAVVEKAKPVLTSNRSQTADAKAQALFERNGADFGAASAEDYLTKVKTFVDSPPSGTDRAERPNGDVLLYHPASNTFAVVARNGTVRTMFKPREGAAYWAEQKAAAPTFGQRRSDG